MEKQEPLLTSDKPKKQSWDPSNLTQYSISLFLKMFKAVPSLAMTIVSTAVFRTSLLADIVWLSLCVLVNVNNSYRPKPE